MIRGLVCLLSLIMITVALVQAEQLPLKSYRIPDGLIHDRVRNIIRDSRGFLWICTTEGLSRFDGYRFVNYGLEHGLPSANISDLLETRHGQYWVGTSNGVARFNPAAVSDGAGMAQPRFTAYTIGESAQANNIAALYEDRAGQLWAATGGGLFRWVEREGRFERLAQDWLAQPNCSVLTLTEDAEGSLWIGTTVGLMRRLPDGRLLHYSMPWSQSGERISPVFVRADRAGQLWMRLNKGALVFRPTPAATAASGALPWLTLTRQSACVQSLHAECAKQGMQQAESHTLPSDSRLRPLSLAPGEARLYLSRAWVWSDYKQALYQTPDGRMWLATEDGLFVFDGTAFYQYTTAHGLSGNHLTAVNEDSDGNLWVGGFSTGVTKIVRHGFTSFTQADGVGHLRVISINADHTGAVYVSSGYWHINRFDGQRFTAVQPNLPPPMPMERWSFTQASLQDHTGEWWVPTLQGLYRFPKVERIEQLARARPIAVYTRRDGLPSDFITYLIEDAQGDLWMGTLQAPRLIRWERATNTFHHYTAAEGLPGSQRVRSFCLDGQGNLWVGLEDGLARYRAGRFTYWTNAHGVPKGAILGLYADRAGRLWVGSALGGLGRIDDPGAETLRFKTYTKADGIAGNSVRCVIEDEWGRIYFGAGGGVDRLDPATGRIKHYTTGDSLANGYVNAAFRDRQGYLWFGMLQGLSRLIPEPDRPAAPTPVWISGLRIAGAAYPVSELGVTDVSVPTLDAGQNRIQIDFFGLGFLAGEPLRYQYKLEGAGQDWSAPTEQRTHEMSLGPGSYRFLVRAVRLESTFSQTPASVSFQILPPLWRRWWFLALAALGASLTGYTLYRYRVAQLIALERVRMRIATDLHDDIGASLSRMAILSEVVKQQTGSLNLQTHQTLSEIADSARGLVDSMSDIVWAIDPRRDDLKNLVLRVRQFAADVLEPQGIAWEFTAPPDLERIKLSPEQRRHLYLIFKEALNNIARHARCASAALSISIAHHRLLIVILDDGCGLNDKPSDKPSTNGRGGRGGNGLQNMKARALELGGALEIDSALGQGMRLTLTIPLRK